MALFNVKKILDDHKTIDDIPADSIQEDRPAVLKLGNISQNVYDVLGGIDFNVNTHYVTLGHWSNHELLQFLLEIVGPSEVFLATWSMSEPAAVKLLAMIDNGLITSLKGILDFRTKNRHPQAFQLAQSLFVDLHMTASHCKVTVIKNEKYTITINGSANYTNNPRIESGVITADPKVGQFHINWIQQVLAKTSPFQ